MSNQDPTNPASPNHSMWEFHDHLHRLSMLSYEDLDESGLSFRLQDLTEAMQTLDELARYTPSIEAWLKMNFVRTASVFQDKTGVQTVPPAGGQYSGLGYVPPGYSLPSSHRDAGLSENILRRAMYDNRSPGGMMAGPIPAEAEKVAGMLTRIVNMLHCITPKIERYAEQMHSRAKSAEELKKQEPVVVANARDARQKRIAELQREISELQGQD